MNRRKFLALGASSLGASALALPAIARAEPQRVIRFIPSTDLTILDPHWTTALITRNHGYLVFDTLYGQDGWYRPTPQMVAGHVAASDGRQWDLTLRPGLKFHDGAPVLARDCVASIKRWAVRDSYGQLLIDATDELSAPDDRTIRFRLKRPFSLLPDALSRSSFMPAMMPERLANTDPNKPVTEMVGSGPFRFVANERVSGARVVYERWDGYVPRPDGTPDCTSGPKVVNVDRVVWTTIPDMATATNALSAGEQDWLEYASPDLAPMLRRDGKTHVEVKDPLGLMPFMRMNHLQPPFDNPGVRSAVLHAIRQSDFMQAVMGSDRTMWRDRVGFFPPGTPLANEAGLDLMAGDVEGAKRMLGEAGYKGERVALLSATDLQASKALSDVAADTLKRMGMNVDYQALDWGSVVQRRASKAPVEKGGWSLIFSLPDGGAVANPGTGSPMRATGETSWFGWPTSPKVEALRQDWLNAPDLAAQQRVAAELQRQGLQDVLYVPLGQFLQPTAYRGLDGILNGFAVFWNVRKEA